MVVHDAAQPAGWDIPHPLQLRRTAQKDHFPAGKRRITGFCHIAKQGIPGRINMIINRIFGDGDVFDPAGGAAGFGKIDRTPLPEHILLRPSLTWSI
jgi:hypothetical protein